MTTDLDDLLADAETVELPEPLVRWRPGARERLAAESRDRYRRHQIAGAHEVNEQFAAYVQSTSFSLTLGRTHVRALDQLRKVHGNYSPAHPPTALSALERRGLVTHHVHEGEPPPFGRDSLVWELTRAGTLVVALLVEAGLIPPLPVDAPLPPPPPGWVDDRPAVEL